MGRSLRQRGTGGSGGLKNTIVYLSNICMCPVSSKMFVRVGNILLLMYARNLKINEYFFLLYSYAYFNSELVASLARS